MIQREYPHNTPEQVVEYIQAALRVVERLEPAEDLRVVVFSKAVDLLSNKQIVLEQHAIGHPNMVVPKGL